MVGGSLQMRFRMGTSSAVGRIALHNRTVHFLYERCDECRLKEVVSARLASRELYRHFPLGFATECFIHLHQVSRIDFLDEIDFRKSGISR